MSSNYGFGQVVQPGAFAPEMGLSGFPQGGATNVRVVRFLIIETGTYNDQYRRPYVTQATGDVIAALDERIDRNEHIVPASISGLANNVLTMQTQPENNTKIINGWGERRLRFMMEIEYTLGIGAHVTEVLTGYTDYLGLSRLNYGGHATLDDDMSFYVNSIIQLTSTVVATGVGRQEYVNVTDNSQLIVNNNFEDIYQDGQQFRMRPTDVYATMNLGLAGGFDASVDDTRTKVTTAPMKSRRSNGLPTAYAANLLESYKNASMGEVFGQSEDQVLARARNTVAEISVMDDPFMKAIAQMRNAPVGNTFTLREIQRMDPGATAPGVLFTFSQLEAQRMIPQGQQQGPGAMHERGQTALWHSADAVTHAAAIIAQAVPSMVADLALTEVAIHTTNMIPQGFAPQMSPYGGRPVNTYFGYLNSFSKKVALPHAAERLKVRLETELLRDLSFNGAVDFDIDIFVNLIGDTMIKISLGGGPKVDFVVPSFCDALLAPVVTRDQTRQFQIAKDFHEIFGRVLVENQSDTDAAGRPIFNQI